MATSRSIPAIPRSATLHARLISATPTDLEPKQSRGRPGQKHRRGAELQRFAQSVVRAFDQNPRIGRRELGKRFGVSPSYVFRLLKQAGRKMPSQKGSKKSAHHLEAVRQALNRPEVRQKRSEIGKAAWKDPEYRERTYSAMLRAGADPKERTRKSKRSKQTWAKLTPQQREIRVENSTAANRARWARAERSEKELGELREIVGDLPPAQIATLLKTARQFAGRKTDPVTLARITLAECLEIEGARPYATETTQQLFPGINSTAERKDRTAKLRKQHGTKMAAEKRRLSALSIVDRNSEAAAARLKILQN